MKKWFRIALKVSGVVVGVVIAYGGLVYFMLKCLPLSYWS